MTDDRLLAAAGVDPSLPAAQQAAQLVRRLPLRWRGTTGSRDIATVLESRWFAGAAECHRVLAQLFRGSTGRGTAFGATWPYLEAGGRIAAPGLPVVVGAAEEQGPDGCYRLAGRAVVREAAGECRPLLALGGDATGGDEGFDILWFASAERYLLSAGILEVEDLFSVLRTAVSGAQIEAWLVRGMRVDQRLLDGVAVTAGGQRPEIEVRRPIELVAGGRLPTPEEALAKRAGIRQAKRHGDEITVSTEDDRSLVFSASQERDGWRLFLWDGDFPYQALGLRRAAGHLRLTATLGDRVDPLAPGIRTRVAFDLRSDLIALG